jgi:hypothetical protein
MKWYKPDKKKPEQGKKILCMDKGDFYVAQRFGNYWFSIPFHDSIYSRYFPPEMWAEISFPEPYTGYLRVMVYGEMMFIDELEKKDPEVYKNTVEFMLKAFKNK